MLDRILNIPAETLIETGLNVVGFLAAGGLLLLVADFVRGRRAAKAAAGEAKAAVQAPVPAPAGPRKPSPSFVSLSLTRKAETQAAKAVTEESPQEATRRNRAEVIRLAKKMIAARESRETIASKLPISEAELTMLSEQ